MIPHPAGKRVKRVLCVRNRGVYGWPLLPIWTRGQMPEGKVVEFQRDSSSMADSSLIRASSALLARRIHVSAVSSQAAGWPVDFWFVAALKLEGCRFGAGKPCETHVKPILFFKQSWKWKLAPPGRLNFHWPSFPFHDYGRKSSLSNDPSRDPCPDITFLCVRVWAFCRKQIPIHKKVSKWWFQIQ